MRRLSNSAIVRNRDWVPSLCREVTGDGAPSRRPRPGTEGTAYAHEWDLRSVALGVGESLWHEAYPLTDPSAKQQISRPPGGGLGSLVVAGTSKITRRTQQPVRE